MAIFVLTETKQNPETGNFLITIKGYSQDPLILQHKLSAHKEKQTKLKESISAYSQKSSQYEKEYGNLLISEFSMNNPSLSPQEIVQEYMKMQTIYFEKKYQTIGDEPDNSLLFTTMSVSEAPEITE